jgi:dTDP-glucose pyrophosphorylase
MSEVTGVILAGGQGSRMGALGAHYPKALLPVANEPLVAHHLRLLKNLGTRVVHLVVGHQAEAFEQVIGGGEAYGVRVHYVDQGPRLGSAHALGRLRGQVREPFLLILGDYYFEAPQADRLLRRLQEGTSAIALKREEDVQAIREACVVALDAAGRVTGIVEKPSAPTGRSKGCGFYALQPEFFDAVARTPRTALRDEYELTVALEQYISASGELYGEEIIVRDANLTAPRDLLVCNLEWLEHRGRTAHVDATASLEPDLQLSQVLVGSHARVEGLGRLERVVVFPGARYRGTGTLRSALITGYGCIDCTPGAPPALEPSLSFNLQTQESPS